MLGIISGTVLLQGKDLFKDLHEKTIENKFGTAVVFISDTIALIPRHGNDREHYILPHVINHRANMKALKDLNVTEVISVNSTGSLQRHLEPGMLVVPDDFIMPSGGPTVFDGQAVHITPSLSQEIRKKWLDAARDCSIDVIDGGVYWQTRGPRFETNAEIRMMSQFADLVGMTMASEAIIAKEMDLPYASLCSVDNYGHGLVEKDLTMDEILRHARKNTEAILRVVSKYMERMAT
jgi:5'-methylthioadenosine phosphorylase